MSLPSVLPTTGTVGAGGVATATCVKSRTKDTVECQCKEQVTVSLSPVSPTTGTVRPRGVATATGFYS